ncbi:hypothetical protein J4G37_32815 [Microvirga sp. 3-52]|nr:hypothetical protein [Microvirga sp. 3-52]
MPRDQHIGIARTSPFEHLGMGSVANHPADVVALVCPPGLLRRDVHHRHIDSFSGKMAGDGRAHLAGTADDHCHGAPNHPNRLGSKVR